MNDTQQQRVAGLVRDRLQGATLIDAELIEEHPGEDVFIALWMRATTLAFPYATEWGTHRVVLARGSENFTVTSGDYFFDLADAVESYKNRTGLRLRGVGR